MIKCKTILNAETYINFNNTLINPKFSYLALFMGLLLLVLGIILVTTYIIIASLAILVLSLYFHLLVKSSVKKHIKSNKNISENTICIYTVTDKIIFEEVFINDRLSKQGEINIADIFKVIETSDFFYIFNTDRTALLLDKNGFFGGSPAELAQRLRDIKPPLKYKLKK